LLYILLGEDDFSLAQSLEEIKRGVGEPDLLLTNMVTLNGSEVTLNHLQTACETLPFMGETRLVIVSGLLKRFEKLYGDEALQCLERLNQLLGRYGVGIDGVTPHERWNQHDVVLITYGDMVGTAGEPPLHTLEKFLTARCASAVNSGHVLPFRLSSSDDGFSVMN
jgi:hypothetical protein